MKAARRKLRVLLIDADGMLRDGAGALINMEEELTVAQVVGGTEALRRLPASTAVDVILVDFAASTVNPVQTMELLRARWPTTPVLVFTLERTEEAIEPALRLGVDGYLLKSDRRTDLLNAIHSVLTGKRYLSPAILDTVVSGFVKPHSRAAKADSNGLSERERQVMQLIAAGLRTREIADKLCVSFKTADKHRSNLMRKLGLRTAAAVTAYAILNGYFPP
jgi:DNA-binding NarL/FixJ family response regulator